MASLVRLMLLDEARRLGISWPLLLHMKKPGRLVGLFHVQ